MFANVRPFIALYSAVMLLMTGIGLLNTYLGLRLSLEGLSTQATGLVLTAYFGGLIFGTFFCKRVIRSVGHIRAYAAFAAVTTSVVMVHGLLVSAPLWAGLRFCSGVANMGLFMVIESWFNECADPGARGRVFSIYMIMAYLGSGLGQQLLNIGDIHGQSIFLVVGIFLVLSTIPVAITHSIHPELPRMEQIGLKTIYRKAPIGMLGCFVTGLNTSAFYAMGSVFAHQINLPVSQVSWFMALTILGGLLFQWPVGALSDRFDRSLLLPILGIVLAAIAAFAATAGNGSLGLLLGSTALFGGFLFTIYPVSVARAHDIFEAQDVVKVSSALLLCFGTGAVLGPLLVSTVMTLSGTPYGFYFYYMATGGLFAVITLVMRQKECTRVIPPDDQVEFVIMKKTSMVALHMDPRQETDADEAVSGQEGGDESGESPGSGSQSLKTEPGHG